MINVEFENGGRSTKPTYILMVIIPLLVMELKATPNGNPSNDFYWRQKSSSLNVVQYNTTSRPIYSPTNLYSLTGKFNQPGTLEYVPGLTHILLSSCQLQQIF